VPGHEVVGVLESGGVDHAGRPLAPGTRAVIEPVLGCAPRHIHPLCPYCAEGHTGLCGNVAFGALAPGLQTGFCTDTGGGWSTADLAAHASQLHGVPEAFSDEDAVMVEPTACAVHAVLSAGVEPDDVVAVIGAGTLGLVTAAALRHVTGPAQGCTVMVGAKYEHQRRVAEALGADTVVPPDQLARAVRRKAGSLVLAGRLTDGADLVFDCVGSSESISQALAHRSTEAARVSQAIRSGRHRRSASRMRFCGFETLVEISTTMARSSTSLAASISAAVVYSA